MQFYTLVSILALAGGVASHGYLTLPLARQYMCMRDGGYWWPSDGSEIPDPACQEAFQHVEQRSGVAAAQYMFTQINEYAALAGPDYSLQAIMDHVVGEYLCSANATGLTNFGDKSGMSIPAPWRPNLIEQEIEIEFCATALHNPSIFYVFISNPDYDASQKMLEWSNLQLVDIFNDPQPTPSTSPDCSAPSSYKLPVSLPHRDSGVLFVWWQRIDPVGEGFYNCADFVMV